MTYYLYKRNDGLPEATNHELLLEIFPGYTLIDQSEQPFDTFNKVFDEGNALIPRQRAYTELRRLEYPPMSDYLDGVVKGDQAQIDAYIAACQAVKDKYPKPSN